MLDVNDMAQLYDDTITAVLDDILPVQYDVNVVHQTHGSMLNAAMPSVMFVVFSVQPVQPLLSMLQLHMWSG